MAYSRITYTADGSTTVFAIPFPYLDQAHVEVFVDAVQVAAADLAFPTAGTVDLAAAYSAAELTGLEVLVARNSSQNARLVEWVNGARLREEDMNLDSLQAFYMAQEALDTSTAGLIAEYSDEQAQDAVGGMLTSSATITFSYNDATPSVTAQIQNGSITEAMLAFDVATQAELDAAIAGAAYTDEQAQDAVGNIFDDTATIEWVYDDGAPLLQASIVAGSVMLSHLNSEVTAYIAAAATPAGSDTQIQYNNAGAFGASSRLTYASNTVTIGANSGTTVGKVRLTRAATGTGWTLGGSTSFLSVYLWDSVTDTSVVDTDVDGNVVVVGDLSAANLSGTNTGDQDLSGYATTTALSDHITDAADAHDASAISIVDAGGYFTGTDVEAALQELGASGGVTDHGALTGLADNDHPQYLLVADIDDTPVNGEVAQPISSNWAFDHVAAADPHTGYRLESADHTHQSTGAEGGQLDHGLALTGLSDDDHTQYMKAESSVVDHTLVRWDGTGGRDVQESSVTLSDAEVMAGLTGLVVNHTAQVTPPAAIPVGIESHSTSTAFNYWFAGWNAAIPIMAFSYSRGATPGTYTVTQNNDIIGALNFYGSDGTDMQQSAAIHVVATGTPANDHVPSKINIYAGTNATLQATVTGDGVQIGTSEQAVLSGTGLTANRTFTFQNAPGRLAIDAYEPYQHSVFATSGAAMLTHGCPSVTVAGTASSGSQSTGSQVGTYWTRRILTCAATTADTSASHRMTGQVGVFQSATATNAGGYKYHFKFTIPVYASNARFFVGLYTEGALASNADPSAAVNMIGVGKDVADSAWQVMHNDGSGAATKVPTGLTPSTNNAYELILYAPAGGASTVVILKDVDAGTVFTTTASTNLPAVDTLLQFQVWANTGSAGGTAVSTGLSAVSWGRPGL